MLLRLALPNAVPHLYRLMQRAGAPAWDLTTYRDLNRILCSPLEDLITDAPSLSPKLISQTIALLQEDPILWRVRHALPHAPQRKGLGTIVALARHLGLIDQLDTLREGASLRIIRRCIKADLGHIQSPAGPVEAPLGWRQIHTLGELWALGRRLALCLNPDLWQAADYAGVFAAGSRVYLHCAAQDVIAELRLLMPGYWTLSQVRGHDNSPAAPEVVDGLSCKGIDLI
jgi:hypothetical protein